MKAITSISVSNAMLSAKVKIYAGSHSSEITDVMPKQRGQEIVEAVRDAQERAPVEAPPAPPARSASVLDELEQLGRLRDSGVLSLEEFDAQKRRILGEG